MAGGGERESRIRRVLGPVAAEPLLFIALLGVALLRLVLLGVVPPGEHIDEASFAYTGWCLAHHGVDEHGHVLPLFVDAHGGWKGPVLTYLLVPFMAMASEPSAALARIPSALAGLGIALLAARFAWTWSNSRGITLTAMLSAAFMPWLFLQSRIAYEDIFLALETMIVLVVLLERDRISWRRALIAGFSLALMPFTYAAGRALVVLLVPAVLLCFRGRLQRRAVEALIAPVLLSAVILAVWSLGHPGALTSRYAAVAVTGAHSGIDLALTIIGNGLRYLGFDFLFTHGDINPRHTTGYGGVLLITTLPAVLIGVATMCTNRRDHRYQFLFVVALASLVPAVVTEGGPIAIRSIAAAPCVVIISTLGWNELWPLMRERRWMVAVSAALVAATAGGFVLDAATTYPPRAARAFATGIQDALYRAHAAAGAGHTIFVSATVEDPLSQAEMALAPPCDDHQAADVGLRVISKDQELSLPGSRDVLILSHDQDFPPATAQLMFSEQVTVNHSAYYPDRHDPSVDTLYDVYRL